MKLLTNAFLLLVSCGIIFSTAACHKINDDQKLTKEQRAAFKNSQEQTNIDATEANSEANAKNITAMMKILAQSDNIFEQVWPFLWEEGAMPVNNVFRVSRLYLKTKFADDGRYLGTGTGCSGYDLKIKINSQAKNAAGVLVPAGYAMGLQQCQVTNDKKDLRNKVSVLMAWNMSPTGDFTLNFESQNYPQGTGLSLKTLGRVIKCKGRVQVADSRLDVLSCEGLGQNKNAQEYIEFTKLEFLRSAEMMVKVVGQRYRNLQTLDRKIDLMVPLTGDINITEEVIPTPKPPQVVQPEVPPTTPEMPTGPIKPPTDPKPVVKDPSSEDQKQMDEQLSDEEIAMLKSGVPLDETPAQAQETPEEQDGQADRQTTEPQTPKQDRGERRQADQADHTEAMDPSSLR